MAGSRQHDHAQSEFPESLHFLGLLICETHCAHLVCRHHFLLLNFDLFKLKSLYLKIIWSFYLKLEIKDEAGII